jgi:hypothetical protein
MLMLIQTMMVRDLATRLTGEALFAKDTGTRVRPTHDEIGRLAYHFYVSRGRRGGHEIDDWLRAERELVHHYR